VLNPTLPQLLENVLGTPIAPTNIPRSDIANVFLLGLSGINRPGEFNTTGANGAPVALTTPAAVTPAEMMRLNTAFAPVARADQNKLGIAGEAVAKGLSGITDLAGFPNGRRPGDDVVDLSLAVVAGALCMLNGTNDALKLNDFKPNPAGAPLFSSQCQPSSVPLGLTSASLHDGIDQGQIPLLSVFPYIPQPRAGSQGPTN
jgi:hypothetical protein